MDLHKNYALQPDASLRKRMKFDTDPDPVDPEIVNESDNQMGEEADDQQPVAYPIAYGCIAWYVGRKADDHNTHNWKVYVRGVDGEDLSFFIDKVVFNLHNSFAKPQREVCEHPYEVGESGWGEFEFGIQLHFVDPTEPVIEFRHPLKLYPKDQQPHQTTKVPVINERYEELVFNSPSPGFKKALLRGPTRPPPPLHPMHHLFAHFDEEHEIRRLAAAQNFVSNQLRAVYRRIEAAQTRDPTLMTVLPHYTEPMDNESIGSHNRAVAVPKLTTMPGFAGPSTNKLKTHLSLKAGRGRKRNHKNRRRK